MRKKLAFLTTLAVIFMWGAVFYSLSSRENRISVRGKSPAKPLEQPLSPEQELAQDLALSDPRVQRYTVGHPSEIFAIKEVGLHFPESMESCRLAKCLQVEIYNFDENATVTAIINPDARQVVDVFHLPGAHPGINNRLHDLAVAIIHNAPEVMDALGYQPVPEEIVPMVGDLPASSCSGDHICAAAIFQQSEQILWAFADLTDESFAGIAWTPNSDPPVNSVVSKSQGCPAPGSINRDGWNIDYEVSGTDGLRVFNVTYNGIPVMTSVKLIEWHIDYGDNGFRDSLGCGVIGGDFPVSPYGETQILEILDGNQNSIGFEVVQDFRMDSWGQICNYRYEQHIQFFSDGRFRVVSGAFGKGCGTNATYRPVVRIDIAVNGDPGDTFSLWDGNQWSPLTIEDYRVPYGEIGHGPHFLTPEGYAWRVDDDSGIGYYIEMDVGQFGDRGRGSSPFIYSTLHHQEEGDFDLGVIGSCCNDDHQQGPDLFVNGESIDKANLVIWHVSKSTAEITTGSEYCWTLQGEPNPMTFPCFTGPMFHPIWANGSITGTVTLEGRTDHSNANISATVGNMTYNTITDLNGNFSLDVPVGKYTLSVEMDRYLDAQLFNVLVAKNSTTSTPAVILAGGDSNDDDTINILDMAFIGYRLGLYCGDQGWDELADINNDCNINLVDLNMASGNFGESSPVPW